MADDDPTIALSSCETCGSSFPRKRYGRRGLKRFCTRRCSNIRRVVSVEKFWATVDRTGGPDACWPWLTGRDKDGYGKVRFNGQPLRSHRLAYILCYGEPDSHLVVRHSCDNPPCCNPAHLIAGTVVENNEDKRLKGRHPFGEAVNTATLTALDVIAARTLVAGGIPLVRVAKSLLQKLSSRSSAYSALNGQTWKYLPTVDELRRALNA
jgi:hypothetical protein